MTEQVQPSTATTVAQEQGGEPVVTTTLPAATSEATSEGQEQQHGQVSAEEAQRRREQSIRDQARHEAMLEYQRKAAEQTARAEAERKQALMAQMDDEDLGRTVRDDMAKAKQMRDDDQRIFREVSQRMEGLVTDALAGVKDEAVRKEFQDRAMAQTDLSFKEWHEALLAADRKVEVEREVKRREKEIREAVENEVRAKGFETVVPQLGTGLPAGSLLDPKKMSPQQKMVAGLEAAEKRRRGG
jgi:hypothetical protein